MMTDERIRKYYMLHMYYEEVKKVGKEVVEVKSGVSVVMVEEFLVGVGM
jgi:hypothetical protein